MTCNPFQAHLSGTELAARRHQNKDFLDIATTQIRELYRFVAGANFVVSLADKDGYILDLIGDKDLLEELTAGNLRPGYRWTEKDVGTSVISLVLARKIPVQVNDHEHFCQRGHGHTCSASPVLDEDNALIGVIAMSGSADQVHPHTLGMVITAARAIENQMRIKKASMELLLRNNYMNAIIESIDSGVIAADKNGIISQVNNQGKQILQWDDELVGTPLSALLGAQAEWQKVLANGIGYVDREIFIKASQRVIHLITTTKPISDSDGKIQGIIFVFNEINRIRRLVNEMAGSQARFTFEDILGVSPRIHEAKKQAILAAAGVSNVLLLGETGTGKELFAQAIHNQSDRRNHPFVALNCGAIPRELLESELFGYIEGAFTGAKRGGRPGKLELASGGTVFLDEIGDMPLDMQVKLLRVLQTGEVFRIGQHKPITVDLRIIAATHFDLKQEVEKGNFREDLFYRLNVLPISISPLRHRSEDIILLARHILSRCCQKLNKPGIKLSAASEQVLCRYRWPGNVRELENLVERAVNLVDQDFIEPELFGLPLIKTKIAPVSDSGGALLEEAEKQTIIEVTESLGYNISQASKLLGISRATLYKKFKQYNIPISRTNV
jgi:transcriptional regulator of acetoin/glycerol metabolism